VLPCVAVCCSVLQCVAVCCSVLQCVAVCCSVLQCVAAHCTQRGWYESCPSYAGVMSLIWKRHAPHMKESCLSYKGVTNSNNEHPWLRPSFPLEINPQFCAIIWMSHELSVWIRTIIYQPPILCNHLNESLPWVNESRTLLVDPHDDLLGYQRGLNPPLPHRVSLDSSKQKNYHSLLNPTCRMIWSEWYKSNKRAT